MPGAICTSSQPSEPKLSRICFAACVRIGAVRYSHLVMARTLLGRDGRPGGAYRSTPYVVWTAYAEWLHRADLEVEVAGEALEDGACRRRAPTGATETASSSTSPGVAAPAG